MVSQEVPAADSSSALDAALVAMMQEVESRPSSQAPDAVRPPESVMVTLKDLFYFLKAHGCLFCELDGCDARLRCASRRYALTVNDYTPRSVGWCEDCDLQTAHKCVRLLFHVPERWDLDVCEQCLWPINTREFRDVHRVAEDHEWFAKNLKSCLGVFLSRKKPYGFAGWHDLLTALNSKRRVTQVSTGQLLVDLYEYLTVQFGMCRRDPASKTSTLIVQRIITTCRMEDIETLIASSKAT